MFSFLNRPAFNKNYYLLAAAVALLGWQAVWLIRVQAVGGVDLSLATIGLYVSDLIMLAVVLWQRPKIKWLNSAWPWFTSPLVLPVYFLITGLLAADPLAASWRLGLLILLSYFILAFKNSSGRQGIVTAVISLAVLQSSVALGQIFSQFIPASTLLGVSARGPWQVGVSVVENAGGRWLRGYGTFPHPNILGGYLVIVFLLVVDEYFKIYLGFQKWWNLAGQHLNNILEENIVWQSGAKIVGLVAAMLIILAGLMSTFSRSSLLALVVGLAVFLALRWRENRLVTQVLGAKVIFIILVIMLGTTYLLPDVVMTRLSGSGRLESRSITERSQSMADGFNFLEAHPWFGLGLSNMVDANSSATVTKFIEPPHNVLLLYIMQAGIVGLLLTLLVAWPALVRLAGISLNPLAAALVASLLTISLFDHYLWSLHSGLLIMATAIIIMVLPEKVKK